MTYATDMLRHTCSAQTVIPTPLGRLLLARTPGGLAGAWFEGQRHHPPQFDAPQQTTEALRTFWKGNDVTHPVSPVGGFQGSRFIGSA